MHHFIITGLSIILVTFLMPQAAHAEIMAEQEEAMIMPEVTIYHLEGRRSERIVWLMEELGLPYKLEYVRGDLRVHRWLKSTAWAMKCRWCPRWRLTIRFWLNPVPLSM